MTIVRAVSHQNKNLYMEPKKKKFIDILFRALQSVPANGFDYLAFRKKLRELEELDDAERYQQAFQAVDGPSAGLEKARASAMAGVEALIAETEKFKAVMARQKAEKVDQRQQRLEQIKAMARRKEAEIESLKEEYRKTEAAMAESEQNIRETAALFQEAYQQMVGQIRLDLEKMDEHLSN